ncbi:hypothetical protein ABE15_03190 [Bacillus cereus]|nr:hypothetical protein [Bacillus cereus]
MKIFLKKRCPVTDTKRRIEKFHFLFIISKTKNTFRFEIKEKILILKNESYQMKKNDVYT